MSKKNARILDATAGNRTMWKTKESQFILFADIEPDLEIKPDKIMDCTKTGFPDKYFNIVFFDPPHGWGKKPGLSLLSIKNMRELEAYPWPRKDMTRRSKKARPYYGWDKFQTKIGLLGFIHKSQEEFYRILENDGVLWFKWSEAKITLGKIQVFFKKWRVMLQIPVCSPSRENWKGKKEKRTYWIMFMKKDL